MKPWQTPAPQRHTIKLCKKLAPSLAGSAVLDLEWKESAIADLIAIIDYISDDNPDAADALMNEIQGKVSQLPAHPKRCRIGRVTATRELVVRPNYIVVYSETLQAVTILRVLHAAQMWP
jgi:toxin ParE1/3/4